MCIRCSRPFRPASRKAGSARLDPGPGNQASKTQGLSTWQQASTASLQGPQHKCQLLGPPARMIRRQDNWCPVRPPDDHHSGFQSRPFLNVPVSFPNQHSFPKWFLSVRRHGYISWNGGGGCGQAFRARVQRPLCAGCPCALLEGNPRHNTPQCSVPAAENPTGETSLAAVILIIRGE